MPKLTLASVPLISRALPIAEAPFTLRYKVGATEER